MTPQGRLAAGAQLTHCFLGRADPVTVDRAQKHLERRLGRRLVIVRCWADYDDRFTSVTFEVIDRD
jgi:hypothetical protein